ncbi:MAG TPA: thiamine pyrophosphate-dependent enzyme [Anaerolineae bacterium]|nr:thiamine pyrophosphate-dependent enzyme [Anaerolineae bacterium]HOR00698.1 thiamine pyrophosphate-dependent enzyme [Anaerolineae bacterium]HPL28433.1 thiamine pyrophosphate-dependent enzyme [Anaerolineae bacterium]
MSYAIPERELMYSGHVGCPGCGASLAMRLALKAVGEDVVVIIVASCWSIIAGPFPYTSLKVPTLHTAFETGGSVSSGIKAALEMRGRPNTTVMAWAGDGGTFDIGFQALSGAVERNEDFIYVCYDNEAYMNTGIQRSSATPWGAWTTTTPAATPKNTPKKDMVAIMAAHRIPYTASASIAYPEDLVRKLQKAQGIRGSKFIHILAPCPSGWKSEPAETIKVSRLAVQSKVFPLYEVEEGERWRVTVRPSEAPVIEYLRRQGRFNHLTPAQIDEIQRNVDRHWAELLARAEQG